MRELAAVLAGYLAFALLHAANPRRAPVPIPERWRYAWGHLARIAAVAAVALSVALWPGPQASALVAATVALMVSGTFVVLVVGVAPRLVWGLALAAPALIAALATAGWCHG